MRFLSFLFRANAPRPDATRLDATRHDAATDSGLMIGAIALPFLGWGMLLALLLAF